MSRRDTLRANIGQSEHLISEYERILLDSSRPEERMRAERILAEQRELIHRRLEEYSRISSRLGEPLPADLQELAATFLSEPAATGAAPSEARPSPPVRPARIFYSYAHKDEKLKDKLIEQLEALRRAGLIEGWQDRQIIPGKEWTKEIDANLEAADIILLLVSPSFVASDYCWGKEMKRAMERHQAGTAAVVPVILRPADWHELPFGKLQALPKDGKPVTRWPDRDEAFLDVARGLRRTLAELGTGSPRV
jgi:hypothetical protein